MYHHRFAALRFALAIATASAFAACSSTITTPPPAPTTGGGLGDNGTTLAVYAKNTTSKSAWVTMYWGYTSQPGWHIDDAHCVKAGETWHNNLEYHLGIGRGQAKIRAEIKNDVNCSPDSTIDDVESPECTIDFRDQLVRPAYPEVRESKGHYSVTDLNVCR